MAGVNGVELTEKFRQVIERHQALEEEIMSTMNGKPAHSGTLAFMKQLLETNDKDFTPYYDFLRHVNKHITKPSASRTPRLTMLDGAFRYYKGMMNGPAHLLKKPGLCVQRSWRNAGTMLLG